ncbi:MAG: hypothetical protein KDH96_09080 [Candidatus Riesia sp.]|nr:hypothetical protein [Candidatus Riesia sp.]
MSSKTEISNIALSHLGIGKEISNLDTERSDEANACRRFYTICKETVLRDHDWPFAKKNILLSLIEENPTSEWAYSYTYPPDCLMIRKILSGIRTDTRQSRVEFQIAYGDSSAIVLCDLDEAEAQYTVNVSDSNRFPSDFVMCMSHKLAAMIAPRLTAGDPFKLGIKNEQMYQMYLKISAANAYNEEQLPQEVESSFVRYREGDSDGDEKPKIIR